MADSTCLFFVRLASRCWISHYHLIVGPATNVGNPTLTVLAGRVGYPRQAHRVSLREWSTLMRVLFGAQPFYLRPCNQSVGSRVPGFCVVELPFGGIESIKLGYVPLYMPHYAHDPNSYLFKDSMETRSNRLPVMADKLDAGPI